MSAPRLIQDVQEDLIHLGDRHRSWPNDFAEVAAEAVAAGVTVTEIARLVGVTRPTVYAAIERAKAGRP